MKKKFVLVSMMFAIASWAEEEAVFNTTEDVRVEQPYPIEEDTNENNFVTRALLGARKKCQRARSLVKKTQKDVETARTSWEKVESSCKQILENEDSVSETPVAPNADLPKDEI
ncbi:MAG: hypothetical protein I8H75_05705 [Myxococcaceae bacterium]|nr:hypothetical protein [Myxococcaceae bacterium]MBH2006812.1 hypothetical protein [Myxococcaceae bacterium]